MSMDYFPRFNQIRCFDFPVGVPVVCTLRCTHADGRLIGVYLGEEDLLPLLKATHSDLELQIRSALFNHLQTLDNEQ